MAGRNLRGQDVRRGRITPAANRGRFLNIPSVRYAAPIEEPEEIEMGLVGLARFDGAPRQDRRVHIEEGIRQVSNDEEAAEEVGARAPGNWTVVQAWTIFGYGTLTLPSYISYDAGNNVFVLKSNVIQKLLCFVQHGFAILDKAMRLYEIPDLVRNNPTPYTFIQISGIFASIGTSVWFFKIAFRNMDYLLAYQNAFETEEEGPVVRGTQSSTHGKLSLVACAGFTLFMVGIKTIITLNEYDSEWTGAAGPAVVQAFACYTKRAYLWRDYDTCGSEYFATKFSHLSYSEVLNSMVGIITFINANVASFQKIVALDVINAAFYRDASIAMDEIHLEDAPVRQTYDDLRERTNYLSNFGGPLLMLQLLDIGLSMPQWSFRIFATDPFVTLFIIAMILGFFSFVFISCRGAQICEQIRDEMMGPRGQRERPFSGREMMAWLVSSIWNKVGIGFTGIYVLNFAMFLTYATFVGAWIMVLYEVEH